MKRNGIFILLVGIGIPLSAQNLTSFVEYYPYSSQIKREYTVLPDGTMHGDEFYYKKSGVLSHKLVWKHGNINSATSYYLDKSIRSTGTVIKFQTRHDKGFMELLGLPTDNHYLSDFTSYSVDRKVLKKYTMSPKGNAQDIGGYTVKSYSDNVNGVYFSLSSDNSKGYFTDNKNNVSLSYNFEKELLDIEHFSFPLGYTKSRDMLELDDAKNRCVINDNTFHFEIEDNESNYYFSEGFWYFIEDASSVKVKLRLKEEYFWRNMIDSYRDYESGLGWNNVSEIILSPQFTMQNLLPNEILKTVLKPYGISVAIANQKYFLKLVKGNFQTGICEYIDKENGSSVKLTIVDNVFSNIEVNLPDKDINYSGELIVSKSDDAKDGLYHKSWLNSYSLAHNVKLTNGVIKKTLNHSKYSGEIVRKIKNDSVVAGYISVNENGMVNKYDFRTHQIRSVDKNGTTYNGTLPYSMLEDFFFQQSWREIKNTLSKDYYSNCFDYSIKNYKGKLVTADGNIFDGVFEVDNPFETINSVPYSGAYFWGIPFTGQVEINLQGGKYVGNLTKGSYSSSGTLFYKNGHTYVGEFNGGTPSGKGKYTYKGYEYVGEFQAGKAHGKGKLYQENIGTYEGQFVNGYLNKEVVYKVSTTLCGGEKYEGLMLKDKLHGHGHIVLPNGDYYKGLFTKNKFSGTGEVRVTTKKGIYEGTVVDYKCTSGGSIKKIPIYKIAQTKK